MRIIPDFELNDSTIETHFSFLLERLLNLPPEKMTSTSISTLELTSVHLIVMLVSWIIVAWENATMIDFMKLTSRDSCPKFWEIEVSISVRYCSVEVSGTRDEASCWIFIFWVSRKTWKLEKHNFLSFLKLMKNYRTHLLLRWNLTEKIPEFPR